VGGLIKWFLEICGVRVKTGFISLRIGNNNDSFFVVCFTALQSLESRVDNIKSIV
jgi:hypothetical protein